MEKLDVFSAGSSKMGGFPACFLPLLKMKKGIGIQPNVLEIIETLEKAPDCNGRKYLLLGTYKVVLRVCDTTVQVKKVS